MNGNKKFSNIKSLGFVTISSLASEAQERASRHEQANLERRTPSSLQAKNTIHQLIHAGRICGLRLDFQLMAKQPEELQNSPRFVDTLLVDLDNLLDALIGSGALKNALDLFSLNFIEQPEFDMSYANGFGDYMCQVSRDLVKNFGVVLLVKGYFIHKGFTGSGTLCSYTKLISTAICTFDDNGACLRLKDRKDNEITDTLKPVFMGDVRVNAYKFLRVEKTDSTVDFAPDGFGMFDKNGTPVPASIIQDSEKGNVQKSSGEKDNKKKSNGRGKKAAAKDEQEKTAIAEFVPEQATESSAPDTVPVVSVPEGDIPEAMESAAESEGEDTNA